jgi:hypothetical protein
MARVVTILALFIHMQRPRNYGSCMLSGKYQRRTDEDGQVSCVQSTFPPPPHPPRPAPPDCSRRNRD